ASHPPTLTVPVGADDHRQGAEHAAVILVEYGDYECPYCGQAYPLVKDLMRQLGDRVGFVFRNFPIATSHPNAELAAEAAEAAAAQGQFWPMHDLLYEHQRSLDRTTSSPWRRSSTWTWTASRRISCIAGSRSACGPISWAASAAA
ncbi:MAG TPA: thioredoxin domain-containing protein, partial [Thermomicrobiales bacterium]|nr:thioredoxin domain-containing protein [Thermomicrobiales bacterium]